MSFGFSAPCFAHKLNMISISKRFITRVSQLQPRFASSLVIAEHDKSTVSFGTLSTITAASKIGGDVSVLVIGKGVDAVAKHAATVKGVSKVLVLDNDTFAHQIAENYSAAVTQVAKDYSHILAPSTANGKNYLPRAAALMNSSPLSDVLSVVDADTFKRPMYAGNAIATVKMTNANKFLLVRTTAFEKAEVGGGSASVEAVKLASPVTASAQSVFVKENAVKSERPDLVSARVVVSGGRGMKGGEHFAMLEALADKLKGAVGASRAAVDAGFVPNDYQIGQTGKVVAPDLYIAVGISGAIQHLSGMKDSKTIVAINKDKEAPIFSVADYGLVDDLFKAVPALTSKL